MFSPPSLEVAMAAAGEFMDSRTDKSGGPDACWPWTGARNNEGYGRGRNNQATRLAWVIAHGKEIPSGLRVCHACDNPPCVNPAHLWLGTDQDNADDCRAKKRMRGGPGGSKPRCGTFAAIKRHRDAGEPLCSWCNDLVRRHPTEFRHGTSAAVQQHAKIGNGVTGCPECQAFAARRSQAQYQRRKKR